MVTKSIISITLRMSGSSTTSSKVEMTKVAVETRTRRREMMA